MSTLQVTNIKATGETASRAVSGVAAAWVNFDGTGTIATRDSQGTSSITDNSSGDYTVGFTNNFANDDFAMSGTCSYASGFAQPSVGTKTGTGKTTNEQQVWVVYNQSVTDTAWIELSFHGDLA